MKTAFDKIAAGLEDAIAFAKGDASHAHVAAPIDVKALVRQTNKTQEQFSMAYGIPLGTLRDWSQQRRQPDATARTLLSIIAADPEAVERLVGKAGAR